MLTLTRITTALYVAAIAVASYLTDPVKVAAIAGSITGAASFLANALPAGTTGFWGVADAIVAGLAVNVSAKTTGAAVAAKAS